MDSRRRRGTVRLLHTTESYKEQRFKTSGQDIDLLSLREFIEREGEEVAYRQGDQMEFYQRNGLNLFFSSLEQEMQYRNWDTEKDGPLENRLMFRDMILLKRPSIRK